MVSQRQMGSLMITARKLLLYTNEPTTESSIGNVTPRSQILVPKLRLGTPSAKLRFAAPSTVGQADAKQSFAKKVPKQSLGTRGCHFYAELSMIAQRRIRPLLKYKSTYSFFFPFLFVLFV